MSYQFTGTLVSKEETVQITDSFKKRAFVVTDETQQYPQTVEFQLSQDKTALLDNVAEGAELTVNFNLRGRQWTNPEGVVKTFNTLDAWKLEIIPSLVEQQEAEQQERTESTSETFVAEGDDDLPF